MEQKRITKNGVEIFSYKNPALGGFYISLYLRAGSMYEEHQGITHFLEHAAIRNVNAVMGGTLYSTLDRHGIDFNATTYSELVQFYISGACENFTTASDIITGLFYPIILSTDELALERGRIKAEIREGDDQASLFAFSSAIVHQGTKLSNLITGTVGSVNRINKKLLENYRRSVMTPENIFFYVTGNFTDSDLNYLSSKIEEFSFEKGKKNENYAPICKNFGNRDGKVHIKNADFTMLRFTFDMDMSRLSVSETDLLYDMLLSGNNSLFFSERSEKRGLCYDLSGCIERYLNIGSLTISFEVRGGLVYEAVETVVSLLKGLKDRVVSESEMMKASYVTNAPLLYDNPSELNFTFAYDNRIMNEGYGSLAERVEIYRAITPERIREIAGDIFRPENLTLTLKAKKKKIDVNRLENIIKNL